MRTLQLLVILILISSCKQRQVPAGEWVKYVQSEESGLRKSVTVGKCRMDVQYYPASYWKAKCMLEGKEYTGAQDSFALFKVYFSNPERTGGLARAIASGKGEYVRILEYLDGDARYDFLFKQATDTALAAMYHYERTYDLVPFDCVNVAFPYSEDSESPFILEYHDNLFCFGIQKFRFDKETIKQVNQIEVILQ